LRNTSEQDEGVCVCVCVCVCVLDSHETDRKNIDTLYHVILSQGKCMCLCRKMNEYIRNDSCRSSALSLKCWNHYWTLGSNDSLTCYCSLHSDWLSLVTTQRQCPNQHNKVKAPSSHFNSRGAENNPKQICPN